MHFVFCPQSHGLTQRSLTQASVPEHSLFDLHPAIFIAEILNEFLEPVFLKLLVVSSSNILRLNLYKY